MRYTNIIWDLDGTLLDTLRDLAAATNHALRTWNMPEHSIDDVRRFVGNGVRKLMIRAVPGGEQNPLFEDVFASFRSYYMEHCNDTTGLYPGISETLHALKSRGIRMAIVSNKLQAGVTALARLWFDDTIDIAVGEREGVARKPSPDMVDIALEALGADKTATVYIGDSDVDIATARNSGLDCISVLWGFRDKDFLLVNGATTLVTSPQEIISIVTGEE